MEGRQEPSSAMVGVQPLMTLSQTEAFGSQGLILIKQQRPFSDYLLCAM